jgi:hypothetical protein
LKLNLKLLLKPHLLLTNLPLANPTYEKE